MAESWGRLQIEVPDKLVSIRDGVTDVASFMNSVLEVAVSAVRLSQSLSIGFADPVTELINNIAGEVRTLVSDFNNMGVYVTGDWNLLSYPFDGISGGYESYERRMIGRLLNTSDYTRPNIRENRKVVSFFFYMAADDTQIDVVVDFVRNLLSFLGQPNAAANQMGLPVPVLSPVGYSANTTNVLRPAPLDSVIASGQVPSNAVIQWTVPSGRNKDGSKLPPPALGGFVVSVSTTVDGIGVFFDSTRQNSDTKESGEVRLQDNGRPVVLFGGADQFPPSRLLLPDGSVLEYNFGAPLPNSTRVFGKLGDQVIPIELLLEKSADSTSYLLQRLFYVPITSSRLSFLTGQYKFVLSENDVPLVCDWVNQDDGTVTVSDVKKPSTVHIRVASATRRVIDKKLKLDLLPPGSRGGAPFVYSFYSNTSSAGVSDWSAPVTVNFPSGEMQDYMAAIKTALLVLILSRPDLPVYDPSVHPISVNDRIASGDAVPPGEALEACGLEWATPLCLQILRDYASVIKNTSTDPIVFRKTLYDSITRVASLMYESTVSNNQIRQAVVNGTQYLRNLTLSQLLSPVVLPTRFHGIRLWDMVRDGSPVSSDPEYGLANNPYSVCPFHTIADEWFFVDGLIRNRKPDFAETKVGGIEDPSFPGSFSVPPDQVAAFMSLLNRGQRAYYEQFIQKDGSILVPDEFQPILLSLKNRTKTIGSADLSPVFFCNQSGLFEVSSSSPYNVQRDGSVHYTRGLFKSLDDGRVLSEASLVLSSFASFVSSQSSGEWISIRAFDLSPPTWEFLSVVSDWLSSISTSAQSVVDSLQSYLSYLEKRIADIQTLISRIDDLLNSVLVSSFNLGGCAAICMVSNGTVGVASDLMSSEDKPVGNKYGAGVGVVIPVGSPLVSSLIRSLLGVVDVNLPPQVLSLLEPPPNPSDSPEPEIPDVL